MAVVITSQVLNPLEAISDNVIFLRNGQVVYEGPTGGIGSERTSNLYECDTTLSLGELSQRIGKYVQDISHYFRILQRIARFEPNDIEQRSREIDDLIEQGKADQAMKRLLDFA